jgi:hypothetical protein
MPWQGPAIQAAGSIIGGLMGGGAADDAAKAQAEAASAAIGEQRQARFANQLAMRPYSQIGGAATGRLAKLLGLDIPQYRTLADGRTVEQAAKEAWDADQPRLTAAGNANRGTYEAIDPSGYQSIMDSYIARIAPDAQRNDPANAELTRQFTEADLQADVPFQKGMQFGLDQGRAGINERAIAQGGYDSGATLKALTRFGTDYGNQMAGAAQGRFQGRQQQQYNMLTGQQAVGQGAAGSMMANNTNAANQIGSLYGDLGNAQAAGRVGQANAMAGAFGGIGTAIQGYQNNQILNKILADRRGAGMGGTIYGAGGSFNPDN